MNDYLVVTEDIPFGSPGTFAYRKGDRIHRDAVEANGWQAFVAGPRSKAAQEAAASASGEEVK